MEKEDSKKLLSKSFIKKLEFFLFKLKLASSKSTSLITIFFKEKRLFSDIKIYSFFTSDISN